MFLVISVGLLLLSYLSPNVVFQVDSVASFLVAMILLLRDPRSRVQTRVLDAFMMSTDRAIAQLSAQSGSSFAYLPEGKTVTDVAVVGTGGEATRHAEAPSNPSRFVPPGRALAELFVRESGGRELSVENLKNFAEPILTDNFGLADSVSVDVTPKRAVVSLVRPSTRCGTAGADSKGVVGCSVASFLAVLFAKASGHPVILDECEYDQGAETWKITMEFGKA